MSGASEDIYFADGIAEDIITELSRYPDLFIVARNSSFTYGGWSAKWLASLVSAMWLKAACDVRESSPNQCSAT